LGKEKPPSVKEAGGRLKLGLFPNSGATRTGGRKKVTQVYVLGVDLKITQNVNPVSSS